MTHQWFLAAAAPAVVAQFCRHQLLNDDNNSNMVENV